MEAVDVTGTLAGHVLPGSMFVVWAVYWIVERFVGEGSGGADHPLEAGLFVPFAKILIPFGGIWVEIPGQGWYPADVMMNWQHVTMYAAFSLSGVVDLLVRRGLLSSRASYVALAAAASNAGLLFWGHGRHGGVPGVVHSLLVLHFASVAGLAAAEAVKPGEALAWARKGALLALGTWFIIIGWMLYRSGWDLADPVREGWAYLAFSWNGLAVSVLVVCARLLAPSELRASPEVSHRVVG